MAGKEKSPSSRLQHGKGRRGQQRRQKGKNKGNGECYIPLLDSDEPYWVERRRQLNAELEENPVDFDKVMDEILPSRHSGQ